MAITAHTIRPAGPGYQVGPWQRFDRQDGFPVDIITAIVQDRAGRMWFSSHRGGLCCLDGDQILVYDQADGIPDSISCMCSAEDGLWLGTEDEGLLLFDGSATRTWTTADGLISNHVSALAIDQDNGLWVGHKPSGTADTGGLSRLRDDHIDTITVADGLAGSHVNAILCVDDHRVWLATGPQPGSDESGGLSLFDTDGIRVLTDRTGAIASPFISCLSQDATGDLWMGTHEGVLCLRGDIFHRMPATSGWAGGYMLSILADSRNRVWFGGGDRGVGCQSGSRIVNYGLEDGLANLQITAIHEDTHGYVWFGTFSGLSRFDGVHIANCTVADGLTSQIVMSVNGDAQDRVWACTGYGVSRFDNGALQPVDQLKNVGIWQSHKARDGSLLLAGHHGRAFRCTETTVEDLTPRFTMPAILLCICDDAEGGIWIGGEAIGLCHITANGTSYLTVGTGLPDNTVLCLLDDGDGVWVGTGKGLCRCTEDGVRSPHFQHPWLTGSIGALLRDRRGRLWVAAREGVLCVDEDAEITTYEIGSFPHHTIMAIKEDRHGVIWFATFGGGVARFDGQILQTLCRRDGLIHDAIQDLHEDAAGDMWIATEGGLTRYRPSTTPPQVRLTLALTDRRHDAPDEVVMTTRQKVVSFEFAAHSLTTRREAITYLCRLRGIDDDWIITRRRHCAYEDLPVGDYVFEVVAVDRDLNRSTPALCRLSVEADARIQALEAALSEGPAGDFVGSSHCLRQVQLQLEQVAHTDVTVLILGETGTGKGLAARALHRMGERAEGPFIQVNCGALPDSLVESELYGHEKGAFTGASARRIGRIEVAQGGTLFLDEIGDMSFETQVKLLRLLEEGTFERVGGTRTLTADVRVVAATNRDLGSMVSEGRFREDLFFRLQVFPVQLPPLRDRRDDIPLLAYYFMVRMAAHLHKQIDGFEPEAIDLMCAYPWPGNVRELEHAVQRAVIVCSDTTITARDLVLQAPGGVADPGPPLDPVEYERQYLRDVLQRSGGVIKGPGGAAEILDVAPSTLYYRLRKLGLNPGGSSGPPASS